MKLEIPGCARDVEVIARVVVLESGFWEGVAADTPPPADGSESAAKALRHLYQGNDTSVDFTGDSGLCQIFDGLAALRAELDAKEQLAGQLKQTLQQAMGDASKAMFVNGVLTYRRAKDGVSLDTKRLTAEHPELTAQYTVIRPGSRRFALTVHPHETARTPTC
jgi:predicted phage-related endonuclease